jgi:hypothetical protein
LHAAPQFGTERNELGVARLGNEGKELFARANDGVLTSRVEAPHTRELPSDGNFSIISWDVLGVIL